ncbi:MAG TPA: YihY/virulence factor BrkB family protein [Thermoleophilaceae bacterium]|nr:YihY/virulence factor BrkB family protein [Thermoleophilaceae bacterium]
MDEFLKNKLAHWAAALTYYGVLAAFPMLLVLVSIVGLVGHAATEPLIGNLRAMAPGPGREILVSAIQNLEKGRGGAGFLLIVGLGGALWSASGYMAAFMNASNSIYHVEETRRVSQTVSARVGMSAVVLVLLAVTVATVGLTGPLARDVGSVVGLGDTAADVWRAAKWLILIGLVGFMVAFLYWAAPNAEQRRFRWVSSGSAVAVLLWLGGSAAFTLFVATFGTYNKTYGPLGGVIVFLIWLWISNIAVLAGATVDAQLERAVGAAVTRSARAASP